MRQEAVHIADTLAVTLLSQVELHQADDRPGIPIQDLGFITDVEYDEGTDEVAIRISTGHSWVIRPAEVAFSPAKRQRIIDSHETYRQALRKMELARKVARTLGHEPDDLLTQSVYEDVFDGIERSHWDHWISGGTATQAEWDVIKQEGLLDA